MGVGDVKTAVLSGALIVIGRRMPILRADRFVEVGWLVLLPATLVQLLVVSVVAVVQEAEAMTVGARHRCVLATWRWSPLLSGALVFRVDSMARATYALAVSFAAVGIQVLLLGLSYIGVITVLMMIMEMAIMAVYMIMFMGMNPALMPMNMVHGKRTAAAHFRGGVFVALTAGIRAGAVARTQSLIPRRTQQPHSVRS